MTLNTWVAGNSGSVRVLADSLRELGSGVEETATGWHRVRGKAEAEWEGPASQAFRDVATRTGKDADVLAALHVSTAEALTVFADELNTVKSRMGQAEGAATEGELMVIPGSVIYPPKPVSAKPPLTEQGRLPGWKQAHQQQAQAEFEAAQALHAKQQAAYAEAQATVSQAREMEKSAHEKLIAALNANVEKLRNIGEAAKWSKAAEHATSPAAMDLASAAVAMENHAAGATKAAFESAMKGGAAPVHGVWSSMSLAQRQDLIDRFPQMIGSTNGVPATARDQANRSRLAAQRAALEQRLRKEREILDPSHANARDWWRIDQLAQAITAIDDLESKLNERGGDYYLMSLDATTESRGRVVIATGNPDTADHVMTYVPGTKSDLGGAMNGLENLDGMANRAEQLAPKQEVSGILYSSYNSPPFVFPEAATSGYSEDAGKDLSQFQESLRITHDGPPSHNTILGHSYGSTVVGETARDYGVSADDIAFIGSPGVGVDQASDFNVSPDHVWSGTSESDLIEYGASINPLDYWQQPGTDQHIHGIDPSDPAFGANTLPTDPSGAHTEYWDKQKSLDGLARLTVGKLDGTP